MSLYNNALMSLHDNRMQQYNNRMQEQQVACSLQLIVQQEEQKQAQRRGRRGAGVSVNNFIQKTFEILQERRLESIVSWCEHEGGGGCSFKIHRIKAFEQLVLPQYFKHSNMSSFVRQLNMYNFHKVRGDKNDFEFEHHLFLKNRPDLLPQIKRKQIDSSPSIPSLALIAHPQHWPERRDDAQRQAQGSATKEIFKRSQVSAAQLLAQSPQKQQNEKREEKREEQRESSIGKPSSNQQQELNRLAELQQLNRGLKKARQAKLGLVKQLILNNRANIANKFNKTVMAIISSKLQVDRAQHSARKEEPRYSMSNLHLIVDHIMDTSSSKSFKDYATMVCPLFDGAEARQPQQ